MNHTPKLMHLLPPAVLVVGMLISGAASGQATSGTPHVTASTELDAGRYLVLLGGCNDCHTSNWAESGGTLPEADRLTGVPVGFKGPWGTTYPSNLRMLVQEMDEEAWVTMLRTRTDRPPMPWININRINEADMRAIYRYIRSLGNGGTRMPVAIAPGVEPSTPYVVFEPVHLERMPGSPTSPNQ